MKWVWEFLRRNEEYRKDYARYASLSSWSDDCGKTGKFSGQAMRVWESMEFRYCDPSALPGETGGEYLMRMDAAGAAFVEMPLEEHFATKWGILYLLNPDDPDCWAVEDEDGGFCLLFPMGGAATLPPHVISVPNLETDDDSLPVFYPPGDKPAEVTLRFDLRFPIDRQLEQARFLLTAALDHLDTLGGVERFSAKGPQQRKLAEYLRAFDANAAGASKKDIAEVMYPSLDRDLTRDPGITRVEHAIAAGTDLVLRGYLDLMRWA